jgi:hypothetical protein
MNIIIKNVDNNIKIYLPSYQDDNVKKNLFSTDKKVLIIVKMEWFLIK